MLFDSFYFSKESIRTPAGCLVQQKSTQTLNHKDLLHKYWEEKDVIDFSLKEISKFMMNLESFTYDVYHLGDRGQY